MPSPSAHERSSGAESQHYFSQTPSSASKPSTVRLVLPDLTLDFTTDSGVFSPSRIDPGTKLLLNEMTGLPMPSSDRHDSPVVVDLGCGYGPIAVTMAHRFPAARVIAVDVNERARTLCARNAELTGVEVEVLSPDDVPASLQVDHLVSNPPIRIGKPALRRLLTDWLSRLAPGGSAHLVVRRQLGADSLAEWLAAHEFTVERVRSRQGYRVLRVTPPGA